MGCNLSCCCSVGTVSSCLATLALSPTNVVHRYSTNELKGTSQSQLSWLVTLQIFMAAFPVSISPLIALMTIPDRSVGSSSRSFVRHCRPNTTGCDRDGCHDFRAHDALLVQDILSIPFVSSGRRRPWGSPDVWVRLSQFQLHVSVG